jgi:cytidyltransferase-like protein
MEIMYPNNPNIILYSAPNIVLHGLQYFGDEDETPEMRSETKQKFTKLAGLIDGASEQVGGEQWSVHGPKIVALKKLADGAAVEEVSRRIKSFAGPVGMDGSLASYVELVVRKYADQVDLPRDVTDKLIMLMLNPDEAKERGISVVNLKKGLPKELQSVVSKLGSKTNSRKYISSVLQPLEVAISDFAIEVLRGVKSFFVKDNDKEVDRMRKELEQSITYLKALQSSGDEKMGELVDKQLAKLGKIENLASSMEGVVFEYPPGSDKIYKLTGAFAMANQIIGRARRSGMQEDIDEEIEIDFVDDESDDPVVDSDYPKTVAVVPGAFKPPHRGHLDMVRKYADMADEVVVIISKPTKRGRYLPDGREITSDDSLKIWQVMVSGMPNVSVEASKDHASPITAAYDFIGDKGPLNVGDRAILGASTKDDDWKRWLGAEKYVKNGVKLLDPEKTAVNPTVRASGEPYSATAFRNALGAGSGNKAEIADFVGEENVDAILDILGLVGVEEMSTAAAAGGYAAPLGYGSARPKKKKKNEYIDISLIDEVIELIMKRGITK